MKLLTLLVGFCAASLSSLAQMTNPRVPGDNFSLEGALELFKKSESPEDFERMLNMSDSRVNNLDLNGDGYIDYIRVIDHYEGDVHAFTLQAVISDREYQDIAVIELERLDNGKAVLQIVGDEDIYGIETIIEPTREVRAYAGSMSSNTIVNVWAWPSVQYIYSPYYSPWRSAWTWRLRPVWWRPWRPVAYVHYYPIWRPYYHYYAPCYTRRVVYANWLYRPNRCTSIIVRDRHRDQLRDYRSSRRDNYRDDRPRNNDQYDIRDRRGRSSSRDAYYSQRIDRQGNARPERQRDPFTSRNRTEPSSRDRGLPESFQRNEGSQKLDDFSTPRSNDFNRRREVQRNESNRTSTPSQQYRRSEPSGDRAIPNVPQNDRSTAAPIRERRAESTRPAPQYNRPEPSTQRTIPNVPRNDGPRAAPAREQRTSSPARERQDYTPRRGRN